MPVRVGLSAKLGRCRKRAGIPALFVLFLGSAVLKLVPYPGRHDFLQEHWPLGVVIAGIELVIAALLVIPGLRRWGAVCGSVLMVGAGFFAVWRLRTGLPGCGCFGGWLRLTESQHMVVVGLTLFFASDHLLSTVETIQK